MTLSSHASRTVAIIGAGPGGLVSARWLRHVGFDVTLFEQGDGVGGQWRVGSPFSSVWPGMHTNTSRVTTAFGDMPHPDSAPTFPSAEFIGDYLERYADAFSLTDGARFGTTVTEVERDGDGWMVTSRETGGRTRAEHFSHVIIASGRHHVPVTPPIEGIETFTGGGGVSHVVSYRGAHQYRGQRVVVGGCSISSLEVASELALEGATRVIAAARRHRYVFLRTLLGVPFDHRFYTRYAGMAWESLPSDATAAALKELLLSTTGHPSQWRAPVHSEDLLHAGFSHSPYYLQMFAEGRISARPFIARVDGDRVHLTDGTSERADAIILCTGYALELPFIGPSIRAALHPESPYVDLHMHTFHPDLPGLAFVAMYEHSGPSFQTIEQQARWIAYAWSGRAPMPSDEEQRAGVAAARAGRGGPFIVRMHIASRQFARAAGVEPDLAKWPELARALLFGVCSPASFRLEGPDALPDAPARVAADGAAFGAIEGANLTDREREQLRALGDARGSEVLMALAAAAS